MTVLGGWLLFSASDCPRVLRDVEGDFAVQVRVGGEFRQAEMAGQNVARRAGLLLTDGKSVVRLLRAAYRGCPRGGGLRLDAYHLTVEYNLHKSWSGDTYDFGPTLGAPAYLRLERRGDGLTFLAGQDGEKWEKMAELNPHFPRPVKIPPRVKVGVFAEATALGPFTARFDQFKLTPLGPDGKPLGGGAR
jgi:regulation of enolase protein 1 (concanavalin A-like superfamily)